MLRNNFLKRSLATSTRNSFEKQKDCQRQAERSERLEIDSEHKKEDYVYTAESPEQLKGCRCIVYRILFGWACSLKLAFPCTADVLEQASKTVADHEHMSPQR